jgi:hypothetical protein
MYKQQEIDKDLLSQRDYLAICFFECDLKYMIWCMIARDLKYMIWWI